MSIADLQREPSSSLKRLRIRADWSGFTSYKTLFPYASGHVTRFEPADAPKDVPFQENVTFWMQCGKINDVMTSKFAYTRLDRHFIALR